MQPPLVLEPQPVLLRFPRAHAQRQRHLLQTPLGLIGRAPHVEDLVRLIVRIGLGRAEKLHLVGSLDEATILYSADVVIMLLELVRDHNLFYRSRRTPSGLPRHIHQTVSGKNLSVEGAIVIVLRLGRVIVRATEIHQISAPIGLHADTGIKGLPAAGVLLLAPWELIQGQEKASLTTWLQTPIIPMHIPEECIELVPVEPRLQIQLIKLQPCLGLESRIEADDGEFLPQMIVHVALIDKENILIVVGGAQ